MKLLLRTRPELAKIENSDGKTPLEIAEEKGHELCSELVNKYSFFLHGDPIEFFENIFYLSSPLDIDM